MKVLVCLDEDGHFGVSALVDRKKCVELLKLHKDYFEETLEEYEYPEDLNDMIYYHSGEEWLKFLRCFEQRGMYEITEL